MTLDDNERPSNTHTHTNSTAQAVIDDSASDGTAAPPSPRVGAGKGDIDASEERRENAALAEVGAAAHLAMGQPDRLRIEKKLKIKLDLRFSILVSLGFSG